MSKAAGTAFVDLFGQLLDPATNKRSVFNAPELAFAESPTLLNLALHVEFSISSDIPLIVNLPCHAALPDGEVAFLVLSWHLVPDTSERVERQNSVASTHSCGHQGTIQRAVGKFVSLSIYLKWLLLY